MPEYGLSLIHIFPYLDRIVFICSRIWAESYPHFPLYGHNHICIFSYLDRISEQRKLVFNRFFILFSTSYVVVAFVISNNTLPKTSTQFCAFKSGVKYLHRSENPFLHPYLISSLHTFEACSKSVQNDIILFSTFCQTHWQASRPSKSLTETVATLKIDGLI